VWNTPIAAGAAVADPKSSAYNAFYASHYNFFNQAVSFGYTNQINQYQHPIFFGYATDPVYKIKCLASWAQATCPTTSFHIPKYAQPAAGGDGHIGVIDYTYNPAQELDMWAASPISGTGGTASAQSAVSDPLNGDGLNINKGVGATGAGYSLWAGVIRPQELIAGSIQHALFLVTPCASNLSVYPSISRLSDSVCSQGVPYGARLRLNLTPAQINALPVPSYHKTILMAASIYGVYQGDNNNTGLNFETEADGMYTLAGIPNPLIAWAKANGVPFDGTAYRIDLSKDVPNTAWQWLMPPTPR
jgi:hypothetical protein